jgi:hypothetical protein
VEGEGFERPLFEGLEDALGRWAGDQRAGAAAGARRREHWLRQQAAESATVTGVLLDLAERRAAVRIDTTGGPHQGQVEAVTSGLCALRQPDGGIALIALPAVTAVHTGLRLATGDRSPEVRLDMAGALAALSADRPEVTLELTGGAHVVGTLHTVGIELASLCVGREPAASAVVVVVDAVTACLL